MIMITCWILWMPCGAAPPGPGEVAAGLCCAVALSARTAPRASVAPAAIGRRSLIPHSSDLVVRGHGARGKRAGAADRGGNAPLPARNRDSAHSRAGSRHESGEPREPRQALRRSPALRAPGACHAGCPEPGESRGFGGAGAGLGGRELAGLVLLGQRRDLRVG